MQILNCGSILLILQQHGIELHGSNCKWICTVQTHVVQGQLYIERKEEKRKRGERENRREEGRKGVEGKEGQEGGDRDRENTTNTLNKKYMYKNKEQILKTMMENEIDNRLEILVWLNKIFLN